MHTVRIPQIVNTVAAVVVGIVGMVAAAVAVQCAYCSLKCDQTRFEIFTFLLFLLTISTERQFASLRIILIQFLFLSSVLTYKPYQHTHTEHTTPLYHHRTGRIDFVIIISGALNHWNIQKFYRHNRRTLDRIFIN